VSAWRGLLPIRLEELSIVFLDDAEMANWHGRLSDDPTPTDILTLDYGEGSAEILISLDTAKRQAVENGNTFIRELRLYLAHGLLHLSGYGDKTAPQRKKMRAAEKRLLANKSIAAP